MNVFMVIIYMVFATDYTDLHGLLFELFDLGLQALELPLQKGFGV
jgi:hypothetical protein